MEAPLRRNLNQALDDREEGCLGARQGASQAWQVEQQEDREAGRLQHKGAAMLRICHLILAAIEKH